MTDIKQEAFDLEENCERIIQLSEQLPDGINDKVIQKSLPGLDSKSIAECINKLLVTGKLDIFRTQEGLLYKLKVPSKAVNIRGDQEEKIVFNIIEKSGNKGIWLRDIRAQSGLLQTQLNKVLKSLETKKLIKSVKSVNANKKKVYMLFDLDPDTSVTGGTWYSDQVFDDEFVELLNQETHRFIVQRAEKSLVNKSGGPLAVRNGSLVKSSEILSYISSTRLCKVQLKISEIDGIMNTLICDGKAEKVSEEKGESFYRAVKSPVETPGLVRSPCGVCPVIKDCGDTGPITPATCLYLQDWLNF